MKVYIVTRCDWDEEHIVAVFQSESRAADYANHAEATRKPHDNGVYLVEEYEVED